MRLLWGACLLARPDWAPAWFHLGNAWGARGDAASAAECWGRAVALDPRHARAHLNLGTALARVEGDRGAAMEHYRRAYDLGLRRQELCHRLGLLEVRRGRLQEGSRLLEEALRLGPPGFELLMLAGAARERAGDARAAAAHYSAAARLAGCGREHRLAAAREKGVKTSR